MKSKFFLFIICSSFIIPMKAQVLFQNLYSNFECRSSGLIQEDDNGYLISGTVFPGDAALLRTDALGNFQWARQFHFNNSSSIGYTVIKCSDQQYLIAGSVASHYFITKVDSTFSTVLWSSEIDVTPLQLQSSDYNGFSEGEYSIRAAECYDNGYAVAGQLYDVNSNLLYYHVMKFDSAGTLLWSNIYDENQKGYLHDMKAVRIDENSSGGILICSKTLDSSQTFNEAPQLTLIDNSGTVVWSKIYGGSYSYSANHILQTTDNGFVITGLGEMQTPDILLFKISNGGTPVWSHHIHLPYHAWGNCVNLAADNGFIIAANMVDSASQQNQAILLKTNSTGIPEWARRYDDTPGTFAAKVISTQDSGFAFCGFTLDAFNSPLEMYLVKTNDQGVSGCFDSTLTLSSYPDSLQFIAFGGAIPFPVGVTSNVPSNQLFNMNQTTWCLENKVNEVASENGFDVFPNPVSNTLTILTPNTSDLKKLIVKNLLGENILEAKQLNPSMKEMSLDVSSLKPGIYFVSRETEKGINVRKFIRQ